MTMREALQFLDTLVDESDPDTELSQLQHLLQTAAAIRRDGHDDWFILAGFLHDLGKILSLFGEPQWAVVGDTFPVGCGFSDQIIYPEYFASNPDASDGVLNSQFGIYAPGCGLRKVDMSWGHDEYLYWQLRPYLPEPALYMIRYHSFYAWHEREAYDYLLDEHDREMRVWVKRFNSYDLYSKANEPVDWPDVAAFYTALMEKYLPATISWPC
jgi:inositol oxygenase